MNKHAVFMAGILLLCMLLCFTGCQAEPVQTQPLTQPSAAASAPTQPTDPPPAPTAAELYAAAAEAIRECYYLKLSVFVKTEQTVGGDVYRSGSEMFASYQNLGRKGMLASVKGNLSFGSYVRDYGEFYDGTRAYCKTGDSFFASEMTQEGFLARQVPALLLNAELYENIAFTDASAPNVIAFSGASAVEAWLPDAQGVKLSEASGKAYLGEKGNLLRSEYGVSYVKNGIPYRVDVTVTVESLEKAPVELPQFSNYTDISSLDAPRLLLQAVGQLFAADKITSQFQEFLICQAAAMVRTYQGEVNLHGLGKDFIADAEYTVSVTDYTGAVTTNHQLESYLDGVFRYSVNHGEVVESTDMDAASLRQIYEDLLLGKMFLPEFMQNVTLTDTGDFYCLKFEGSGLFADSVCQDIYELLQVDLDGYASSYSTAEASGYLTLDKNTGLPTALGQRVKRIHVIDSISYELTYDYNQSILLSSAAAYEAITGEGAPEEAPAVKPTPLFYKVTGSDGESMWLLGTIHVGDNATAYLPREIYDALDASDALAVEMDVNAFEREMETNIALQQQISAGYYYNDGTDITDHIDDDVYQAAKALMMATGSYSINAELLKPSLWENVISTFLLQQSYGLSPDRGVDQRLLQLAEAANKPILDVEEPVGHVLMPTYYSDKLQQFLLEEILTVSTAQYAQEVEKLYALWCAGDEEKLKEAVKDDVSELTDEELLLYAEYNKAMMDDRNAHMLQVAMQYLESGDTVFYAVGLAHVLAHDGLVNTLRDAGYTVELVTYAE